MKRLALLALLSLPAAVGCDKPTEEQCKRICWKAGELAYWHQVEQKLAAETDPAEREVIREEAEEKWKELKGQPFNPELSRCEMTCQKDGRPKQVECIDKAENYADVGKCMEM